MLSVLIVDDEEWVRYLIKSVVEWEKQGFKIIGEASNGYEALDLIKSLHPDVVITDIKMPKMDGIEMMAEAKAFMPDTYFIMLSGYDSFEYAQKSLNLGAFAYLLKPVDENQMLGILERLKCQKTKFTDYENLKVINIEYQKKNLLGNLIDGEMYTDEELARIKEDCSLSHENRSFYVLTIYSGDHGTLPGKDILGDFRGFIEDLVYEAFSGNRFEIYCLYRKDKFIGIISVPDDENDTQVRSILHSNSICIIEKYRTATGMSITAAYDGPCSDIRFISGLYMRTLRLLDYRLVLGPNRIIDCSDVDSVKKYSFVNHQTEYDLIQALEFGNTENVIRIIKKVFDDIKNVKYTDPLSIRKSYHKMLYGIIDVGYNTGISMHQIIGDELEVYDHLDKLASLDYIENVLLQVAEKVSNAMHHQAVNKTSLATKAKEFIRKHYAEDISLETIAESVYMSPYYFSSQFKKEAGQNLSDFITGVRINAACQLLKESKFKIYEIGDKVGYKDPKYFCRIFKKVTGISPVDYRKKL